MSNVTTILQNPTLIDRFQQSAPQHITHQKEVGFAIQLLNANDYLSKVAMNNQQSLLSAVSNVAFIGLSLNPALKEAYLVPRKGKICLDPSYGGMIKLATDSGSIVWVQANLVYANDSFMDNGAGERPTHTHDPFSQERGEFVGAYCLAKTKEGDYLTTTMSAAEIHEIRDGSDGYKSGKSSPWHSHFGEMAKKTVIRRAHKTWPRSNKDEHEIRLARAVQMSNENEGLQLTKSSPDMGEYSDETKVYFDQLIEKSEALEMHIFQRTTEPRLFTNLYHSFDKGNKGKYQRIIDELLSRGHAEFHEYVELWSIAKHNGDETGMEEIRLEVSDATIELIERWS